MEKVLRKVSVKDRLPNGDAPYVAQLKESFKLKEFYFSKDLGDIWFEVDGDPEDIRNVIYWYEEVSLVELLPKQAISHLSLYDEAKKRYEKALKLLSPHQVGAYTYSKEWVIEALKIATGLEEDGSMTQEDDRKLIEM